MLWLRDGCIQAAANNHPLPEDMEYDTGTALGLKAWGGRHRMRWRHKPCLHPSSLPPPPSEDRSLADSTKVDRAQVQFKKLQRAEEGKAALSSYEAERAAERAKTARLKALRLARDAELGKAPAAAVPAKSNAKTRTAARAKAKTANLSQWLKNQSQSGRNS
jgi:hypothetical protein